MSNLKKLFQYDKGQNLKSFEEITKTINDVRNGNVTAFTKSVGPIKLPKRGKGLKINLSGDFTYNPARLINHSCNPNCEVDGKGLKLWIFALRDIKKGEELSYDYGFGFDQDYKQFPCRCGTKNCCGYIVREGSRWRIKKSKKYKNLSK